MGVIRDSSDVEGGERGVNIRGKKWHKPGCGAGIQGPRFTWGEGQGPKYIKQSTGGEGRQEWTSVPMGRRPNTRREGVELGAKRVVRISLRVADGGVVRTQRVTLNDTVNS